MSDKHETTVELDEWVIARKKAMERLQACQTEHRLNSCMPCEKFLDCDIRDAYVKAVYDSMNKGTGGGFEF